MFSVKVIVRHCNNAISICYRDQTVSEAVVYPSNVVCNTVNRDVKMAVYDVNKLKNKYFNCTEYIPFHEAK